MIRQALRRRRFRDWPILLQVTALPLALLLLLLLTISVTMFVYSRTRETAARVTETYAILSEAAEITRLVIDLETGVRGFALARDEAFLEPYLDSRREVGQRLTALQQRVAGSPAQEALLGDVLAAVEYWNATAAAPVIQATRAGQDVGPFISSGAGKRRIDAIRDQMATFERTAAAALAEGQAADARWQRTAARLFVGTLLLAAGACVLAYVIGRGIVQPVRALAAAAERVARGDLDVRRRAPGTAALPLEGANELAVTGRAFDTMAAALLEAQAAQAANARFLEAQAQAAYRAEYETLAVLDATSDAIVLISPDRRFRLLNRPFCRFFAVDAAELTGGLFHDFAPHIQRVFEDPEAYFRLVAGTADDAEARFTAPVRQRWPEARDLQMFTSPVPGPRGEALGRLYCFRDVTQAREVERLQEERRLRLEEEVASAAQLQAALLPRGSPRLPGFELAARCIPARQVGGDFYAWHDDAPGVLTVTLGDVMGKGLPAALLMATVRAALEAVGPQSPPDRAVAAVAATVERDLERVGSFVTLFHARVDAITRRVDFVDAGHGHVFVRRSGGVFEALWPRCLPLGVLPAQQYPAGSIVLDPGDTLVVFSDGLLDARPERHLTAERVSAGLDDGTTAEETLDRLIGLSGPTDSLPDDLTVIVLRCQGAHFATRSTPALPPAVPVAR